jgi:hypothetical protein
MAQDFGTPVTPIQEIPPAQPPKNNSTIWIIIAVVVVLLCCCCLIVAGIAIYQNMGAINNIINGIGTNGNGF